MRERYQEPINWARRKPTPWYRRRFFELRRAFTIPRMALATATVFAATGAVVHYAPSTATMAAVSGCLIKGNVDAVGERIYHVPGSRYYEATVISGRAGERWFCSEEQALRAGWRKPRADWYWWL